VAKFELVGKSPNQFILKEVESGVIVRVPKDPGKIPAKSVLIGTEDLTGEVKKMVAKLAKEEVK